LSSANKCVTVVGLLCAYFLTNLVLDYLPYTYLYLCINYLVG
jgi:hypothetical protein